MINFENLQGQFAKAGLRLEKAKKSFALGSNDVFGMDITRKVGGNRRDEWFRIWPGSDDNVIQVSDIDKEFGQIVLTVREKAREFENDITPFGKAAKEQLKTAKGREKLLERLVSQEKVNPKDIHFYKTKGDVKVTHTVKSPGVTRKFLLGLDELQLFIAQVERNVTTVKQAHDSLRAPTVTTAEGKLPGRAIRQGEWFFVHPTEAELAAIKAEVKKHLIFKKQPIGNFTGRRGNPHTADELVVTQAEPLAHGHTVRQRGDVFVRGKVTHRDHKTVSFSSWRKVIGNREATPASFGRGGIHWID